MHDERDGKPGSLIAIAIAIATAIAAPASAEPTVNTAELSVGPSIPIDTPASAGLALGARAAFYSTLGIAGSIGLEGSFTGIDGSDESLVRLRGLFGLRYFVGNQSRAVFAGAAAGVEGQFSDGSDFALVVAPEVGGVVRRSSLFIGLEARVPISRRGEPDPDAPDPLADPITETTVDLEIRAFVGFRL